MRTYRTYLATATACLWLSGCNYSDLRPQADIDNSAVTQSVTPIQTITPVEPLAASIVPLADPSNFSTAIPAPSPSRLIGPAPKTPPIAIAPSAIAPPQVTAAPKQTTTNRILGVVTAGLMPRLSRPNMGMPEIEAKCRTALKRAGVAYTDLSPINGNGSCGIRYPVKVTSFAGNIEMKPAATLNCQMALRFSEWVRKDLQSAARLRYASGVKSIGQMSAYSCRKIAGSARMSEHSYGNAIDIGSFTLNNGKTIKVEHQSFFAIRNKSLLNEVRADACNRFTTVLGPGYNKAHADHFHFDLMSRRRTTCK